MADHYYTPSPGSQHAYRDVEYEALGHTIQCRTDAGVFSKDGLDPGSRLMIESLPELRGRVLDLGCGWGAMGISLAKAYPDAQFVLTDVNERAVALCRENMNKNGVRNAEAVVGDGFERVEGSFDLIFTNPPIRAGKQVIYGFFDEAKGKLNAGGYLYIVIRKQQGAPSALTHLKEVYGNAEVVARGGGYWIIRAWEAKA